LQIVARQQRGGGNQHHAQFDRSQHGLPQRHLVAHHQQNPVALARPQGHQPIGHLVGALRQLGIAQAKLLARGFNDVQSRGRVVARDVVKVVQPPIEMCQLRPVKRRHGGFVVGAVGQQGIAAGQKLF
jgi:hypothetical protein